MCIVVASCLLCHLMNPPLGCQILTAVMSQLGQGQGQDQGHIQEVPDHDPFLLGQDQDLQGQGLDPLDQDQGHRAHQDPGQDQDPGHHIQDLGHHVPGLGHHIQTMR